MPKYLFMGSYTDAGVKRLLKDGAQARVEATTLLAAAMGAKVEAFYFAFGTDDFVMIADSPDNISAAAGSLYANATGITHPRIVVLMTPEEMQASIKLATGASLPPLWGTEIE